MQACTNAIPSLVCTVLAICLWVLAISRVGCPNACPYWTNKLGGGLSGSFEKSVPYSTTTSISLHPPAHQIDGKSSSLKQAPIFRIFPIDFFVLHILGTKKPPKLQQPQAGSYFPTISDFPIISADTSVFHCSQIHLFTILLWAVVFVVARCCILHPADFASF